jgi:hypothetical protein
MGAPLNKGDFTRGHADDPKSVALPTDPGPCMAWISVIFIRDFVTTTSGAALAW